jgi:hypothetical protein
MVRQVRMPLGRSEASPWSKTPSPFWSRGKLPKASMTLMVASTMAPLVASPHSCPGGSMAHSSRPSTTPGMEAPSAVQALSPVTKKACSMPSRPPA